MNKSFAELFGSTSSAALDGWRRPVLTSTTFPAFVKAGRVRVAAMGATGSGGSGNGAANQRATGANSAPWGVKVIQVAAGDVLSVEIGAGGAPQTGVANGAVGSSTVVRLNGVAVMTCQPGEPGVANGAATAPTATVVGADWVVPGRKAGEATGSAASSGGAAVDVFRTGLGDSLSIAGGSQVRPGASVGAPSSDRNPLPLFSEDLGVLILGSAVSGHAGVGGIMSTAQSDADGGIFAGGAAGYVSSGVVNQAGRGGRGGGGGGSAYTSGTPVPSGRGGDGYADVVYVPEG